MVAERCEDCQPSTSTAIEDASVPTASSAPKQVEDVMNPSTFVKPDLKSEVHVVIEYCNRWWVFS